LAEPIALSRFLSTTDGDVGVSNVEPALTGFSGVRVSKRLHDERRREERRRRKAARFLEIDEARFSEIED
jgi:hypothetical protein